MVRHVLLLLLFGVTICNAQSVIEINDSIEERIFMPVELSYFIDSTNTIPFHKISSRPFASEFRQHSSYLNIDFETNASYWVRLQIKPNLQTKKNWLLEFYDQTIDSLEAFIPQHDATFRLITMGDHQKFYERIFKHKNFEMPLEMRSAGIESYFFKVR